MDFYQNPYLPSALAKGLPERAYWTSPTYGFMLIPRWIPSSHGCWLSREVLGGELFPELEAPAPDAQPDPMHLEAGFLSAQPSPALGIVEVARPAATFNTTMADLESIRFDVPEMAPVDCSSSDVSNNVTVSWGS